MEILYSEKAAKYLKKLAKSNQKLMQRMIEEIETYARNPNRSFDVKVLKGNLGAFKRLRVGDYRILFDDEDQIMHIYDIKHRREAYR